MTSQASLLASPTVSAKMSVSSRAASHSNIYKSLEDIQNNLTSLDNFLTITEDILRRERFRDMELYQRERERKDKTLEPSSAPPPLSFKNGKIFCLGDDGTKFNQSNVQLTHEIVKQIIKNQNNFLCYDNHLSVSEDPDPSSTSTPLNINLSEEQDIFLTHQEDDDDAKLKSFNELLMKFSPTSSISSKIDENFMKELEEEIKHLKYNRSDTVECMTVAPESPEYGLLWFYREMF